MTTLSPAAQAVWSAFLNHSEWEVTTAELCGVAAALRAAAEVLREAYANERYPDHPDDFLFDIAAELEGANG
jgi:hypothetical protein